MSKEGWTHVSTNPSTPGRPPCQRSLHAAAVLNDSMYIFGGYDGLNRVNDFYEFHFPSRSWRQITTNAPPAQPAQQQGGGGGLFDTLNGGGELAAAAGGGIGGLNNQRPYNNNSVNTVIATGTVPSPRDRHAAVVHQSSFYIMGGFDGTSRVSDLYAFDVDRLVWREVRPRIVAPNNANNNNADDLFNNANLGERVAELRINNNNAGGAINNRQPHHHQPIVNNGAPEERGGANNNIQLHHPSPRHSHAAVVYNNSMFVFGGYDGSYRSDFHEFDLIQLIWKPVPASGRPPRARYRSTACVRGDTMILFGGHDGTRHLADVHLFDFVNRAWSLLAADGVPPLPRDSHVSVAYKDSMYVFGGSTGSAMNDLYELNFQSNKQETIQMEAHVENGRPEEGEGAPTSRAVSAKWRQVPLVRGGIAVQRFCHVGAIHKGSLYVFGGYDGTSRLNDFVKYDLAGENAFETEIPPSTLLSDLRSFLNDEDVMSFADITLMVEGRPIRAHKMMLMRCPYFRAMLTGEMAESSQSVVNLAIVRHDIFLAVREYLYTDNVVIPLDSAMELFVAADMFGIPRLQLMCERKLLQSMTVENSSTIFHAADVHSASSLRDKALGYILSNFEAVSKTAAFEEMARSNVELVFEILKGR